MKEKKDNWLKSLFGYAQGFEGKLTASVILSVTSIMAGLVPFLCMYEILKAFIKGEADTKTVLIWCGAALFAYLIKVLFFGLSTGLSHNVAYHILAGLRKRLTDCFLHAPLGEVEKHSIGEIKSIMVDKIENIEPPLAHMIPEDNG